MTVSEASPAPTTATPKLGGPSSPRARVNSAKNSLKHGLSGSGKVLSEADTLEIERRARGMTADMKPMSPNGKIIIWQLASLSYRAEKAVAYESAAVAMNVRHAAEAYDEERFDRAKEQFAKLAEDPRSALRKLRRTPEGVELLFDAWRDLKADLGGQATWTDEGLQLAANMTGLQSRHARGSRFGALTLAMRGDLAALEGDEVTGLDDEFRREWAKSALIELIDAELAELAEHYQTLDFETIELDRREAGQRALFDTSKAACLARRYESELRRGFYKALQEFRRVEEESAIMAQAEENPPAAPPEPPQVGSFREIAPPADREPSRRHPAPFDGEMDPSMDALRAVSTAKLIDRMNN